MIGRLSFGIPLPYSMIFGSLSSFLFAMSVFLSIESPPRGSNPRPRPYQGRALPTELGGQRHFSGHEKRVALRNSLEPLGQEDYPPTRRKRQGMPRKASLSGALQPDDGNLSGRLLQVIAEARVLLSVLLVEAHALGLGRDDGLRLPALLAGLDGDVGIRLQVVEPRGVLRSAAHRRDDDEVIALVRVDDGDSVLLAALRSLGRQHEHVAADEGALRRFAVLTDVRDEIVV